MLNHRNLFAYADLTALRTLLDHAIHTTFARSHFSEVAALASRLIARRAASFRAQNGFRLMRKTNIALCRLHECNVRQELEDLLAMLPAYRGTSAAGVPNAALHLPKRDNVDYVLLRLRQLATLLQRIASCARESSELFLFYVHRRYFLETAVVHVAVLADIWLLAHRLCVSTVQFYDALRPYARHFGGQREWLRALTQPAGSTTLAGDEALRSVLPVRLADCLGDEWPEECRRAQLGAKQAAMPLEEGGQASSDAMLFGFDSNSAEQDSVIMQASVANATTTAVITAKKPPKVQIAVISKPAEQSSQAPTLFAGAGTVAACEDIGVAIPRPTPNTGHGKGQGNSNGLGKRKKPALQLDKLVSADDVQAFMRAERAAGEVCGALGADRWKELQRKCNHILVTTQGRNTVRAFRQLWTQTVLSKNNKTR